VAGVAVGAAAQTVTGIGLVLVCGPVLVLLLGTGEAVRVALVTSLALNAVLVARQPRAVQWRPVTRLSAPAVAAAIPLGILVHGTDDRALTCLAGAAMITAAGVMWRGRRWPWLFTPAGTLAAGMASGAMNAVAGAAGPFAALYAVSSGWPPPARVATLQAYFAVLNVAVLATLGLPRDLAVVAAAGTGLAAGVSVGHALAKRLPESRTRQLVLLLAAAGGVTVVTQALT
jgi:hypothetical protein